MIRVLLVEDAPLASEGLANLLGREEGIDVVGSIDIEGDVVALAGRIWPRVIVINTDYMVSQVLPLIDELKARNPAFSILMLSDPSKRGMLPPRRQAREISFMVKGTSTTSLAEAIRRMARGERVIDRRLQVASIATERGVTTREWEILALAAQGDSVAEIAHRLYLALGTVRNYLSSIIAKTGARNRIDAIRIARQQGWLR